jgi:hypothetical protein
VFRPSLVSVKDEASTAALKAKLAEKGVPEPRIASGEGGNVEVAKHPDADIGRGIDFYNYTL